MRPERKTFNHPAGGNFIPGISGKGLQTYKKEVLFSTEVFHYASHGFDRIPLIMFSESETGAIDRFKDDLSNFLGGTIGKDFEVEIYNPKSDIEMKQRRFNKPYRPYDDKSPYKFFIINLSHKISDSTPNSIRHFWQNAFPGRVVVCVSKQSDFEFLAEHSEMRRNDVVPIEYE